jgi:hypothetical protein
MCKPALAELEAYPTDRRSTPEREEADIVQCACVRAASRDGIVTRSV